MYGSTGRWQDKPACADLESGSSGLYPGISEDENVLRWAFIRKVYGILSVQVILTMAVVLVVANSSTIQGLVFSSPLSLFALAIIPFVVLCALSAYHQSHPTNLILLGLFTVSMSLTVGLACAFTPMQITLEALALTAIVTVGLTAYTFWAARRGHDFSFLGPMLFAALLVLVFWSFIQLFFPLGRSGLVVYSLLASLVFALYIVFDMDNLIKRYSVDEYVWASVAIYLDVINLFLNILTLLRETQGQQ